MIDPRFYKKGKALTLQEVADRTGATLKSKTRKDSLVQGAAPLHLATPEDVTFLSSPKHTGELTASNALACFVTETYEAIAPPGMAVLVCDDPHLAYATIASSLVDARALWSGVSDDARIDPSAKLATGVVVAPGAVIAADVEIGSGSIIGANAVISVGTTIGEACFIGNNVSISHSLIGDRVILHAGVCIGQDGFGFVTDKARHKKIVQLGRVIIQDDVDIGANTTVDRGAADDTVIGAGTKIDNQVQIGHNCRIGRHCLLVGQVGLAGSVTIEDFCVLGGRVAVMEHVTIGKGAQIAGASGITKDIPPGAVYAGFPAKPIGDWRREIAMVTRLGRDSRSQAKNRGKRIAKE